MADSNETILISVDVDTQKMQKELSDAIRSVNLLKQEQKLLTKEIEAGNDVNGEYAKLLTQCNADLEQAKRQVKSQTAVMQAATAAGLKQNASLDEQRQYLETLQKAYANLSGEQKEMADQTGGLRDQIKELSDSVKEQEMAMGDARRNVGNYRESLMGLSDAAHNMKEGLDGMGVGAKGLTKGLDGVDKISKVISKNPLLGVITIVIGALTLLKDKISENEEAMGQVKVVTAGLGGALKALDPIIKAISKVLIDVLGKAIDWVIAAIKKALEFADRVAKFFGKDLGIAQAFADAAVAAEESTDVVEEETAKQVKVQKDAIDEIGKQREEMERRRRTDLQNTLADYKKAMEEELKIKGLTEEEKAEIEAYYRKKAQEAIDKESEEARKAREEEEKKRQEELEKAKKLEEDKLKARQEAREKFGLDPQKSPEEQELEMLELAREKDLLSYEEYEIAKSLIQDKYRNESDKKIQESAERATEFFRQQVVATTSATSASLKALSSLMSEYAEESKSAAKAQKAFAFGSILINEAMSIAEGAKAIAAASAGAAQAAAATGPAAPIMFAAYTAEMVGAVISVVSSVASTIVEAKNVFSQGKNAGNYATGGIVGGTSYSGDKLTAHVNSREGIFTVEQQKRLFDIANGGQSGIASEAIANAFANAVAALPAPVMAYTEFASFEQKTAQINEIAKL